jgi:hypothetical protein
MIGEPAREALPAPRRAPARHYVFAVALAAVGGVLGIIGAVIGELQSGGWLLLPLIGAPVIEEAMKPAGVYITLLRWPNALSSRLFTAFLAALGGLVFGLIEAIVYVTTYVSDPPEWFVTYRFTLPLALHATASFIFGLGITTGLIDWAAGRGPLPLRTRNFYIAAVVIHAIFNTTAVALWLAGVFDV